MTLEPEPDGISGMQRIVEEYESCEDPYLASEYLDANGITFPVIRRYRQLIEADRRRRALAAAAAEQSGRAAGRARQRGHKRRSRPAPVAPPGHPGIRRRTVARRNRRGRTVVITVRITFDLP